MENLLENKKGEKAIKKKEVKVRAVMKKTRTNVIMNTPALTLSA